MSKTNGILGFSRNGNPWKKAQCQHGHNKGDTGNIAGTSVEIDATNLVSIRAHSGRNAITDALRRGGETPTDRADKVHIDNTGTAMSANAPHKSTQTSKT